MDPKQRKALIREALELVTHADLALANRRKGMLARVDEIKAMLGCRYLKDLPEVKNGLIRWPQ